MKKQLSNFDNAIFSSLSQPVLICDSENRLMHANYAAEDFFSMSISNLLKLTLDDFIPFGSPILSMAEKIVKNNAPISEYRIRLSSDLREISGNSEARIVDVFATPLLGSEDRIILLFQERTTADKIDRQLISRNAVRSVSGLAAMLAHEIKNPLSGIKGAAQLLEKSVLDDDVPLARLIKDETDRIVNLLEKVDIFGDERPLLSEAINIHVVLDRVKLLAKSGDAANIEFIEQYDPSLPPVLGNKDQLIQVLLNLVKNSTEALSDTNFPTIKLSTAFRPGIHMSIAGVKSKISLPLEIIIEDNGAGVSQDILANMFDPFVSTKPNGTGLGLALVAKIIGDHGGIIDVESQKGKTRFRILLPIVDEKQSQNKQLNSNNFEDKNK